MDINPTDDFPLSVSLTIARDLTDTFKEAFFRVLTDVNARGRLLCQRENLPVELVDSLLISFTAAPAAQLLTFMLSGVVNAVAMRLPDVDGASVLQTTGMSDAQYQLLVQAAQGASLTIEENMKAQDLDKIFSVKITVRRL